MHFDEVQPIVDTLAARLGRSVAVDDPSIRLIAASRHFGDEDAVRVRSVLDREVSKDIHDWVMAQGVATWTEPTHMAPCPDLGISTRVCAPVRCNTLLLGYLWLIDDAREIGADDLRATAEAADAVGLVLYRRMLLRERERSHEESVLRMLISPEREDRRHAIADLVNEDILANPGHMAVLVLEIDTPPGGDDTLAMEASIEHLRRTMPARSMLTVVQQRRAILVLAGARPHTDLRLRAAAELLRERVAKAVNRSGGCAVGISVSHPRLEAVVDCHREAVTAVRAARLLPVFGEIASWATLGPFGLLLRIDFDELAAELPFPGLKELLGDPAHAMLVETAEEFLDRAGDVNDTAQALHVHRTTLYHRLKRAESVSGLSLSNGLDRLTLHLALKLSRLASAHRTRSATQSG
ncbi:PucR family transcriptional regulator [Streptomyces sp. NPDC002680]|uniref:PucR family transcriptional regulator n=1 Tax=Streptomyces sp. NPDC002680 TaxID=3364659 RepID=UPI0036905E58